MKTTNTPSVKEQIKQQQNLLRTIKQHLLDCQYNTKIEGTNNTPTNPNRENEPISKTSTKDNKEKVKLSGNNGNDKQIKTPHTLQGRTHIKQRKNKLKPFKTRNANQPYTHQKGSKQSKQYKTNTKTKTRPKLHNITKKDEHLLPAFQMYDDSSLPHVQLQLPKETKIAAVIDSGASHCYMGSELFNIIGNDALYVKKNIHINVQTGNGKIATSANVARIPTKLRTSKGQHLTYYMPFLVVDFLGHEAYIGVSVIFKTGWFKSLTEKYLHTNKRINKRIPIKWISTKASAKLIASVDFQLLPKESIIVPTHPKKIIDDKQDHIISAYQAYGEEDTPEDDAFNVIPQITSYNKHNFYNLVITNNSNDPIAIGKNTAVAKIECLRSQQFYTSIKKLATEDISDYLKQHNNYQDNTALVRHTAKRTVAPHALTHPHDEPIQEHLLAKTEQQLRTEEAELRRIRKTTKETNDNKNHNNDSNNTYTEQGQTDEHANNTVKDLINNNKYMDEEDKRRAMDNYEKYHYFEQTPTEVADKGRKSTILKPDMPKITVQEAIAKIKTDHLSNNMKQMADNILDKHKHIFALSEYDIGSVDENIAVCDPEIKQEFRNDILNMKYIPPPFALKNELDRMIQTLEDNNIVASTDAPTPVISNILITRKKSGAARYILDSRGTNLVCKRQQIAMTPTRDVLQEAGSADFVTVLDITNAFFSINVAKSKTPLFSFYNSKRERKCFIKMPQGFHSSPTILQKCLNSVTKNIPECLSYADDLFLCTKLKPKDGHKPTYKEKMTHHLEQLDKLLESISTHNLKLKSEKMFIANDIITILGYTLNKRKYYIPEAKVTGITSTPKPKTLRQVSTFLCKRQILRRVCMEFRRNIRTNAKTPQKRQQRI